MSAKFGTGELRKTFEFNSGAMLEPGDVVTISESGGEGKPFRPVTAVVTACIEGADRVRTYFGLESWLAQGGSHGGAMDVRLEAAEEGSVAFEQAKARAALNLDPAWEMDAVDERVLEGIKARMRASIEAEMEAERAEELVGIKEKLLRKLGVAEPAEPARSMLEKPKRAIDLELA